MRKSKAKNFIFVGIFFVIFFVLGKSLYAQESSDAISVRVIPNPSHYSSLRWYGEQGFIGTPQQLLVDGYDAVRNGNTVYVNAANISSSLPQTLYTNIYIISFNIKADKDTEDIFALILKHWKFNINIESSFGYCSPDFSSTICSTNNDCQIGTYCSSKKAETIRDTTRLASMAELNIALENYMTKKGYYPKLSAGSYLPNKTVSTWPSWQGILSQELGTQLSPDPINELGDCVGYNNKTCWDERTKTFADSNLRDPSLNLPKKSKAFVYQVSPDGLSFTIFAEMESGFVY